MRQCRHVFVAALAATIAIGVTGCAEEPPAERYTQTVEEQGSQEPVSLKDTWDKGTTVHRASLPPPQVVYSFPPQNRPTTTVEPVKPRVTAPKAPAAPKQRPATPNLAISAPPTVPAAPPKALTESDLQQDTMRCGVGIDCLAVLRAMIADQKQSWMMRTPTPAEFANGTRLFAYRALRKTLDCGKLRFAGAELEWAMDTFGRDVQGMDAAHRARVSALAAEVRGELEDEILQRC
jgi:hypothetical protein